jgi:hypothetical protein
LCLRTKLLRRKFNYTTEQKENNGIEGRTDGIHIMGLVVKQKKNNPRRPTADLGLQN